KQKFADMGMEVVDGSPADFSKFIGNDITKWRAPVVKRNIKPD
ncbi:MAG: tripartite tricarboxylate transporter substrate binding protein, partial [Burkholderiaceae bacterium]|nr:tripartite tricarboxylate transporter substrate binding protein [Burkholderiaceae bacterium]